jgi:hypothetical protein
LNPARAKSWIVASCNEPFGMPSFNCTFSPVTLGVSEPRNPGTPELRNSGTPEPRNSGTPELRNPGTPEPRNPGTPEPRNGYGLRFPAAQLKPEAPSLEPVS